MTKRRSLVAGIKPPSKSDQKKERAFVFGKDRPAKEKKSATVPAIEPEPAVATSKPESAIVRTEGKSPVTTRIRSDLAEALKRASLERQLAKVRPSSIQDILEVALEPWLRDHGYLK
jgi:hypothetical protein